MTWGGMLLGAKRPGMEAKRPSVKIEVKRLGGETSCGRNDLLPFWIDMQGVIDSMPGRGSGIKSHSCAKPIWLNLTICF